MLTSQVSAPIPAEVVYRGWSHGQLPLPAAGEWAAFAGFWDDLPPDTYVKPGHGTVRYRRLGRLFMPGGQDGACAEILPPDHFVQSKSVNSVYGGQPRVFASILQETYDNGYFRSVLGRDLATIREIAPGDSSWLITVHLIRIEAAGDASSAPAPEGRHSDGHDFIVMHLIGRKYCVGGGSSLYRTGDRLPVVERTLQHSMETLVIDDRAIEHEVSPITASERPTATRDMMIVDFERADAGADASRGLISLNLLAPNLTEECVMPITATAAECVLCRTEVTVPSGSEAGDIVSCHGCGQELEVMELAPAIRLELAPEIEEDWGE